MPWRCVVMRCSNVPGRGCSLHWWPKEKKLAGQWKRFVDRTRSGWGPSESSQICSHHFRPEDFSNYTQYSMGLSRKLLLRSEAVPSIYPVNPVPAVTATAVTVTTTPMSSTTTTTGAKSADTTSVMCQRSAVRKQDVTKKHEECDLPLNVSGSAAVETDTPPPPKRRRAPAKLEVSRILREAASSTGPEKDQRKQAACQNHTTCQNDTTCNKDLAVETADSPSAPRQMTDLQTPSQMMQLHNSQKKMLLASEKERLRALITSSLLSLCQSGLPFESECSVEALVGITLDQQDVVLININQLLVQGQTDTTVAQGQTDTTVAQGQTDTTVAQGHTDTTGDSVFDDSNGDAPLEETANCECGAADASNSTGVFSAHKELLTDVVHCPSYQHGQVPTDCLMSPQSPLIINTMFTMASPGSASCGTDTASKVAGFLSPSSAPISAQCSPNLTPEKLDWSADVSFAKMEFARALELQVQLESMAVHGSDGDRKKSDRSAYGKGRSKFRSHQGFIPKGKSAPEVVELTAEGVAGIKEEVVEEVDQVMVDHGGDHILYSFTSLPLREAGCLTYRSDVSLLPSSQPDQETCVQKKRKCVGRKRKELRKRRQYPAENLEKACRAVTEGDLSLVQASTVFKVPHATISYKIKGKKKPVNNKKCQHLRSQRLVVRRKAELKAAVSEIRRMDDKIKNKKHSATNKIKLSRLDNQQ